MKIDWKNVLFLSGIIVLCILMCGVLWACVWVNEQLWLHVSPLVSWICAIFEVGFTVLVVSLRKKK